jgi:hypothetical protein
MNGRKTGDRKREKDPFKPDAFLKPEELMAILAIMIQDRFYFVLAWLSI